LGLWEDGGGRIFSFSLRKWSKKIGVGMLDFCPFLAGFGSFEDLSGLCIFVHLIFVTSRFPKPYVFFAAQARFRPLQAPPRARANIFHFDSKWSKKIGPSLHRPAPHRLLVDAKWSKKISVSSPKGLRHIVSWLIQTARKNPALPWAELPWAENLPCPVRRRGTV
jgi:hypothetical protein